MIQDKNEPETASTPENSKNAAGITVPDMEKLISILKEKDTSAAYKLSLIHISTRRYRNSCSFFLPLQPAFPHGHHIN